VEFGAGLSVFSIPMKVFFVDLLLSGDNAVLIAMACRSLAPDTRRTAVMYGTCAAIVLRFLLATTIGGLMLISGLKLIGAVTLLVIAIKLIVGKDRDGPGDDSTKDNANLWASVRLIIIADVIMSLDNVVAVAAVAEGSWTYMAFGLIVSVPLLIYGSMYVSGLLNKYPILITVGGAMLAWTAGDLAVGDPFIEDWVNSSAFALHIAAPIAAVIFVLVHSRTIVELRSNSPLVTYGLSVGPKTGWSIAHYVERHLNVEPGDPAPVAVPQAPPPHEIAMAPPELEPLPVEEEPGRSKVFIICCLIGGPLLYLALMAYWFWVKATSG